MNKDITPEHPAHWDSAVLLRKAMEEITKDRRQLGPCIHQGRRITVYAEHLKF